MAKTSEGRSQCWAAVPLAAFGISCLASFTSHHRQTKTKNLSMSHGRPIGTAAGQQTMNRQAQGRPWTACLYFSSSVSPVEAAVSLSRPQHSSSSSTDPQLMMSAVTCGCLSFSQPPRHRPAHQPSADRSFGRHIMVDLGLCLNVLSFKPA